MARVGGMVVACAGTTVSVSARACIRHACQGRALHVQQTAAAYNTSVACKAQ